MGELLKDLKRLGRRHMDKKQFDECSLISDAIYEIFNQRSRIKELEKLAHYAVCENYEWEPCLEKALICKDLKYDNGNPFALCEVCILRSKIDDPI